MTGPEQPWSRRGWFAGAGWLAALAACAGSPSGGGDPPMRQTDKVASPPAPAPAPAGGGGVHMVDPAIEGYAVAHTVAESEVMRAIAEETRAATEWSIMMIGPLEAALLRMLVRVRGARRVVEVGTFTGYSAIAMAEGMPDDGVL